MEAELKERDRAREDKKTAAKRRHKEMGAKWQENERLVSHLADIAARDINLTSTTGGESRRVEEQD